MGVSTVLSTMSRGVNENNQLKTKLETQLSRLLDQLHDIETTKDSLDEYEYLDLKNDTLEQLQEFETSLNKMLKGEIGLVDSVGAMQLAIQAAISQAFQTPEILKLFIKAEPSHLRDKLAIIQRDFQTGKMDNDLFIQQKTEILSALIKLNESLTENETRFMDEFSSNSMKNFTNVQQSIVIKDNIITAMK